MTESLYERATRLRLALAPIDDDKDKGKRRIWCKQGEKSYEEGADQKPVHKHPKFKKA